VQQPEFITNALNLLRAVLNWMLILIPVAAGAGIAYHSLMKQVEEGDSHHSAQHTRAIKNILVAGAIGMSASVIATTVLGFFR
jgi:hypothetical protein